MIGPVDEACAFAPRRNPIEVVRAKGQYFVMALNDGIDVERDAHRHDDAHV